MDVNLVKALLYIGKYCVSLHFVVNYLMNGKSRLFQEESKFC